VAHSGCWTTADSVRSAAEWLPKVFREIQWSSPLRRFTMSRERPGTRVEVPIHPDLEAQLLAIAGDNTGGLLCPTLAYTRVDGRHGLSRQFADLMSAAGRKTFTLKMFHIAMRPTSQVSTRADPSVWSIASGGAYAKAYAKLKARGFELHWAIGHPWSERTVDISN
jgi:hypothetical protein